MRAKPANRTPVDALRRVKLTDTERRAAEDMLAKGEQIAEAIMRMARVADALWHGIERGIRAVASRRSTN